jgi:uncharacterized RDD family membrane protein YckC
MDTNQMILDQGVAAAEFAPNDAMASAGKRFANYLIDLVFFYTIFILLVVILTLLEIPIPEEDLVLRLISMLIYAAYCFAFESTTGKTLGKVITKTRVVNDKGQQPATMMILKRSFFRIIPFDQLSFLGGYARGWHDRWSDTWVIDEKRLAVLMNSKNGMASPAIEAETQRA